MTVIESVMGTAVCMTGDDIDTDRIIPARYLKEISLKGNKTFFDTNTTSHHHFYDQDSGDLMDIKNEDIYISKLPTAPKGKKINGVEVTVSVANNNHNQKK